MNNNNCDYFIHLISISPPVKSKEEKVLETDRETRERDRERESGRDWIFLSL